MRTRSSTKKANAAPESEATTPEPLLIRLEDDVFALVCDELGHSYPEALLHLLSTAPSVRQRVQQWLRATPRLPALLDKAIMEEDELGAGVLLREAMERVRRNIIVLETRLKDRGYPFLPGRQRS